MFTSNLSMMVIFLLVFLKSNKQDGVGRCGRFGTGTRDGAGELFFEDGGKHKYQRTGNTNEKVSRLLTTIYDKRLDIS
ncbi:MAG: hypothetical protein K5657_07900 [Desulfovibrio sp.]|nr:hypothetical protein [Desulfovibrio sp.]